MFSKKFKLALGITILLFAHKTYAQETPKYAAGVNLWGRPGLILGDSFERFPVGTWIFSTHYAFQSFASGENISLLPLGITFMATDNLVFYANTDYKLFSAGQGFNLFVVGGKLGLRIDDPAWQFSLGGDVSTGPLSNSLGPATTDFIPTGTVRDRKSVV